MRVGDALISSPPYNINFNHSFPSRSFSFFASAIFVHLRINKRERGKMGFIMEFAENLILRMMEDPKERDRKFREHLYDLKDRCQKTKEMWNLPMRPYGFWTFERHNSQLAWDAQISQVPGRRDPYDDLLEDKTTKL